MVHYVDLPVYGTPMSLAWKKHRMRCVNERCAKKTWVLTDHRIAAKNCLLTTGRPNGRRARSATDAPSKRWPPSWPVTGTRSMTP